MNKIHNDKINEILNRTAVAEEIKNHFIYFQTHKNDLNIKRGVYLYGESGVGKTTFIVQLLKSLNYDVVVYTAGDIRNATTISEIAKHNLADRNIMSLFSREKKQIVIVMDEIDGMNNGDKGGINALIKMIRPKKTKKQKQEDYTMTPIVCIGSSHMDKKIKELMKVCNVVEIKKPEQQQIHQLIQLFLSLYSTPITSPDIVNKMANYVGTDLKRLDDLFRLYEHNPNAFMLCLNDTFIQKSRNYETKDVVKLLLNEQHTIEEHNSLINDADRTSVGLLWHENIIDYLGDLPISTSLPIYVAQLNNICYSDYIDRITFQRQIWIFNEMSSLIKTMNNNRIYHTYTRNLRDTSKPTNNKHDIRFTKVLTKYSTEYNNKLFIQRLCQKLNMDKKDMVLFFYKMKLATINGETNTNTNTTSNLDVHLEQLSELEITKLDVMRMFKYIDKYLVPFVYKKHSSTEINELEDLDDYEEMEDETIED